MPIGDPPGQYRRPVAGDPLAERRRSRMRLEMCVRSTTDTQRDGSVYSHLVVSPYTPVS